MTHTPETEYESHRRQLVHVLQMAYSGEKSAALAYQGHADSVRDADEKDAIRQIERDEWEHREEVGRMLARLNAQPCGFREGMQTAIGTFIKWLCPISGWLAPMIGAWLLEEANVAEYDKAATHAEAMTLPDMAAELRAMSATERDHAEYFKGRVFTRKKRWGWL